MNIIYCKVWDKRTGTWVVASELAKGGKKTSRASASRAVASVAAFLVLTATTMPAWSADENWFCVRDDALQSFRCGTSTSVAGNSVAIGHQATANGTQSVTIGHQAKADGVQAVALGAGANGKGNQSTAVGMQSSAVGGSSTAVGFQANTAGASGVALGYQANASKEASTSIGTLSDATGQESTAIGNKAQATGTGAIALGGALDVGGVNHAANALADDAIAVGREANVAAGNTGGIAFGSKAKASSTNTMALGFGALANQTWAAAFGYQAEGTAVGALALGAQAYARGGNATALGTATRAIGAGSSAFGYGAWASGAGSISIGGEANGTNPADTGPNVNSTNSAAADSIAIGSQARVDATTSTAGIAIGRGAKVNGAFGIAQGDGATSGAVGQNVAIGSGNTTANSSSAAGGAVAIGRAQNANGNGAVAIGDPNNATGTGAVAVGADNTANGQGALAQGNLNNATGQGALALGNGNTANGQGAVALGNASSAGAAGAVALGDGASAGIARSVALGSGSTAAAAVATANTTIRGTVYNFAGAAPTSTVSVGAAGSERTVTNVAAGRLGAGSTDAVNGSQLFATNQAVQAAGAGFALTAQGANGSNVDPSESIDLRNADGNILVSKSGADNNVSFELADDIVVNSVTAGNSKLDNTGLVIAGGPKVTAAGIDAGGKVVGNVAAGVAASDGVNKSQLDAVAGAATSQGLNFTGNDAAAGTVHRDLGQTLSIAGDASTAGSYSGGNLKTVTDPATGAIKLQLADSPKFGNTVVNDGGSGKISGVTAGALGAGSTEAVNGAQLFQTNQDVAALGGRVSATEANLSNINNAIGPTDAAYQDANGRGVRYVRTNDTGIPQSDAFATGRNATAVGYEARASAEDTIAIGERSKASGISATAIGSNSQATADYAIALGDNNVASGAFSSALGDEARATDSYATAVGAFTVASSAFSTALGYKATTAGFSAVAIGNAANASAGSAIAIGAGSNASVALGVALGANSVADGAGIGVAAYVPPASTYAVAATAYNSEVSVGAAGSERRITHLAAGATDTDAVNVSQLKAVDSKLDALGQDSLLWDPAANGGAGAYNANHGGTGPNKIVNVAAADLSAASSDAVNGSQLFQTNQNVAGLDSRVTAAEGNITNLDNRVTNVEGQMSSLGQDALKWDAAANGGAGAYNATHGGTAPNKIVNVAAADLSAASSDAVNGSQLFQTNQNVAGLDSRVTTTEGNVSNLDNRMTTAEGDITNLDNRVTNVEGQMSSLGQDALKWDAAANGGAGAYSAAHGGTAPNKIVNVAAADLSAASSDAVNGSQLFQTNQNVAGLDSRVTTAEGNITNLDNRVTNNEGAITNLQNQMGPTDPAYLQQNGRGTRYARTNDTGLAEDDAHAQGVGSTALGYNAVSSAADAVAIGRGAQASHAGSVALGAGSVADGSTLGNAAYLTGGTATGEVNIGNRRLTGVAAGAQDTDAVNVAQLKAVSVSAAQAEQRAVKYDWNDANGNGQIDPGEVDYSKATLAGPASSDGGVTGGTRLGNVAQGAVSATSTDAVNGAQLYAVAGQSDAAYVAQNGRGLRYARSNDTGLAEADAHAQGVGSSAVGYNATAAADNAVAIGREAVAGHANSVALGAGSATTAGAQTGYNGAYVGSSNSTGQVQIGGRTLGGLAAGTAADDAVNVAQLQAGVNDAVTQANSYTDARVAQVAGNVAQYDNRISTVEGDVSNVKNGAAGLFQVSQDNNAAPTVSGSNAAAGGAGAVASGNGSTALGNGAQASGNNAVALGAGSVADQANTVSMGSAGGERRVTNIAAGVADTDAVNVSQLKGFTTGGVQYDKNADGSNNVNSLTFNPNGSGQTTLHNVAAGTAATDAVNVGQLQGGIKDAVVQANGYTDGQVAAVRSDVWKLGGDVRRLERDMQSGIATAIAIKPAPYVAGRTTYYAGFGAYKSQAAFGVSLRRTADSGRWSVEGGASSNRDGTGVYLGVSGVLGD